MNIESITEFLLWCTIINYGILLIWFLFFAFCRDFIYRLHSVWFNISQQNFDTIHYTGMAIYKIGIILFNMVPLLVLYMIT